MQALILTGGLGTRLRPITYNTLKPLLPLSNAPFLCYPIASLRRAGVSKVILCSSDDPAPYSDLIAEEGKAGTSVICSREKVKLGTGGAIKNAEEHLQSSPFFAMNGDSLTDLDFSKMLEFHKSKKSALTLALIPMEDPSQYGLVETDADSRILKFIEKPLAGESPESFRKAPALINGGMYLMEREILDLIPSGCECSIERDIFPKMIRENWPMYGYKAGESTYWLDIGTPDKYLQGNLDVALGRMKPVLPQSVREPIAEGILIPKSACVAEDVVIGKNCVIGENSILKNCVLLEGAIVQKNETVQNCILDKNCRIDL
jgi:NDP-sugar pyrophosphorylase family protein